MESGLVTNINYLGLFKEHEIQVLYSCVLWKKVVLAIQSNTFHNISFFNSRDSHEIICQEFAEPHCPKSNRTSGPLYQVPFNTVEQTSLTM